MDIANLARDHEVGHPIPHIDYTPEERQTWATVLQELTRLYPTHGETLPGLGLCLMTGPGLPGWHAPAAPVLGNVQGPTIHSCGDAAKPKRVLTLGRSPEQGRVQAPPGVAPFCSERKERALSGHSPERGHTGDPTRSGTCVHPARPWAWAAGTSCGHAGFHAHAGLWRRKVTACACACLCFSAGPGLSSNIRQVGPTAASRALGPQKRIMLPYRIADSGSCAH